MQILTTQMALINRLNKECIWPYPPTVEIIIYPEFRLIEVGYKIPFLRTIFFEKGARNSNHILSICRTDTDMSPIFYGGYWQDLKFYVQYQQHYDYVQKVAQSYEKISGNKVYLTKNF